MKIIDTYKETEIYDKYTGFDKSGNDRFTDQIVNNIYIEIEIEPEDFDYYFSEYVKEEYGDKYEQELIECDGLNQRWLIYEK